jgi:hypothetical protein
VDHYVTVTKFRVQKQCDIRGTAKTSASFELKTCKASIKTVFFYDMMQCDLLFAENGGREYFRMRI